jgi:F-type H+-transporting ATPase subunit epsilon
MKLQIINPDKELFSGETNSVVVPGIDGEIGILNNHAPLLSSLKKGELKVKVNDKDELFEINGGVVEVLNNNVIVLAI